MVEHAMLDHPQERKFKIEAVCYPGRTLLRQATEANQIQRHKKLGMVINRRGEWGQNLPPKLTADPAELQDAAKSKKRKTATNPPRNPGPKSEGANPESGEVYQQCKKVRKKEPKEYKPRMVKENSGTQGAETKDLACNMNAQFNSFNKIKSNAKNIRHYTRPNSDSLEPTNGSAKGIIQMRELRKLEVGNYVENESTSQMEGHGTRAYIRPKQESSAISLVAKPSDNVILPEEDPNQDPKNL